MKGYWIRWIVRMAAFPILFLWFKSLKWRLTDIDPLPKRSILIFWHRHIFSVIAYLTAYHKPEFITALVSRSADGRMLQEVLKAFGFNIVEGSSSSGGFESLLHLHRRSQDEGIILITPDGPRGPAAEMKPGALLLSRISGNPLICASVEYERTWQAESWDKAIIPKPFSMCRIFFSEPIIPDPRNQKEESLKLKQRLESSLHGH